LKDDFIIEYSLFNQKKWRTENEMIDNPGLTGYNAFLAGYSNCAWITKKVFDSSDNEVAGFLLANGILSCGVDEYKICRKII
jgi:type I restriction-modification system DNA methylase subunit